MIRRLPEGGAAGRALAGAAVAVVLVAACGGPAARPAAEGTTASGGARPDEPPASADALAPPPRSGGSAAAEPAYREPPPRSGRPLAPDEEAELLAAGEAAHARFESVTLPVFRHDGKAIAPIRACQQQKMGHAKAAEWESVLRLMEPAERRKALGSAQFQCWAETDFVPWLEQKTEALGAATKALEPLALRGSPPAKVLASSLYGQMHLSIAETLRNAPIDPSIVGDQELEQIYRDALDSKAQPYREQAAAAFERCRAIAAEHGVETHHARRCSQ